MADAIPMTRNTRPLLDAAQRAEFQRFNMKKAICCLPAFKGAPVEALIRFKYLSKGAANVIFTIQRAEQPFTNAYLFVCVQDQGLTEKIMSYDQVINRVLRIPRGRAKHLTCDDIVVGFEEAVRPVFLPGKLDVICTGEGWEGPKGKQVQIAVDLDQDLTKHLMDLKRVALFSGVMAHLACLTEPGTFEQDMKGDQFKRKNNLGLLLPDMTPIPSVSVTLEIKPKWLLQSPAAPANAVRCRTCAMQVAIPKDRERYICPLRLVHGSQPDLSTWAWNIIADQFGGIKNVSSDPQKKNIVSRFVGQLIEYLTLGEGRTLLLQMQFLQGKLDPQGISHRDLVDSKEVFDHNLRLAMTLRDCSLFIAIPYATNMPITSKLGDLDFKSAEKFDDWLDKELMLVQDEVYTKDTADGPECWLGRVGNA
ncbi:Nn.00g003310.m01.CDS01 [Neocucurbitaria sp. VM-36]